MDLLKERLLVSDVRLKRYIRDYFMNVKKLPIFVSKVDNKTVDATDRFAYFIAELILKDEKKYETWKNSNLNILTSDSPPFSPETGSVNFRGIACRIKGIHGYRPEEFNRPTP